MIKAGQGLFSENIRLRWRGRHYLHGRPGRGSGIWSGHAGLSGVVCAVGLMAATGFAVPAGAMEPVEKYMDLPLEDLMTLQVVSVSRKRQQLGEVASAVFVITREDIHRSGVTTIPEALRMAPGIQVARIDANKWVIASRGFGSQFSNKLLVMIDGRTVYSPSYSGVYWDARDTVLEDIDRIEVIRGPGASVWGANTVNGVINIITRNASETRGGLMVAGAGNEEKAFATLRYGAALTDRVDGRLYLKFTSRDSSYAPLLGEDGGDDWQGLRTGFRIDGRSGAGDTWKLQGDLYSNDENQRINLWQDPADPASATYAPFYLARAIPDDIDASGGNLLGRWEHRFSGGGSASLQVYYDRTRRAESFLTQTNDTLDIDFNHRFGMSGNQEIIWGLGYRYIRDDFDNTFMVSFLPDSRDVDLFSAFVQDEIELMPGALRLTLGSKFEHNDYTGFEIQPTARLSWLISRRSTAWGAVSRAVRTPSRLEDSALIISQIVPLPPPSGPAVLYVHGDNDFSAEKLIAWELGYRHQPCENFSLDLALFYNDYDDLQTFEQLGSGSLVADTRFGNGMRAHSYGLELSVDWWPLQWWRLQGNYSYLDISATLDASSRDLVGSPQMVSGSSPMNQFSIRSLMNLGEHVDFDLWVLMVDGLERPSYFWEDQVDGYVSVNARLAWRPWKNVELSLVGQNLADDRHLEYIGENLIVRTEVERSVYGMICLDF